MKIPACVVMLCYIVFAKLLPLHRLIFAMVSMSKINL